jgi:putative FmdB family regulatory protein
MLPRFGGAPRANGAWRAMRPIEQRRAEAMPTYDYQCQKCDFEFERIQRITEDPIKTCPECKSRKAKRLLSAPNFILKGGGWYADGYGSSGGGKPSADSKGGDDSSDNSSSSDSKKDKKDKKSSDSKSKSSSSDGSSGSSSTAKSGGGKAKKSAA